MAKKFENSNFFSAVGFCSWLKSNKIFFLNQPRQQLSFVHFLRKQSDIFKLYCVFLLINKMRNKFFDPFFCHHIKKANPDFHPILWIVQKDVNFEENASNPKGHLVFSTSISESPKAAAQGQTHEKRSTGHKRQTCHHNWVNDAADINLELLPPFAISLSQRDLLVFFNPTHVCV